MVRESVVGFLSFLPILEDVAAMRDDVNTTNRAKMIERSSTDGVPHVDSKGSGK